MARCTARFYTTRSTPLSNEARLSFASTPSHRSWPRQPFISAAYTGVILTRVRSPTHLQSTQREHPFWYLIHSVLVELCFSQRKSVFQPERARCVAVFRKLAEVRLIGVLELRQEQAKVTWNIIFSAWVSSCSTPHIIAVRLPYLQMGNPNVDTLVYECGDPSCISRAALTMMLSKLLLRSSSISTLRVVRPSAESCTAASQKCRY